MKEQYNAPKTEVILLEEEDIILTSGGDETRSRGVTPVVDVNPDGAGTAF